MILSKANYAEFKVFFIFIIKSIYFYYQIVYFGVTKNIKQRITMMIKSDQINVPQVWCIFDTLILTWL